MLPGNAIRYPRSGDVAADPDVEGVREALGVAGIEAAGPEELGARVAVVPAALAKGLEYDHVVAVDRRPSPRRRSGDRTGCTWC